MDEEATVHSAKAHDYAQTQNPLSNFYNVAAVTGLRPWQVGYMFMATKFFRLVNLVTSGEEAMNEPVEDTLSDLSVYAKLTRIMLEEEKAAMEMMQAQMEAQQKEEAVEEDDTAKPAEGRRYPIPGPS